MKNSTSRLRWCLTGLSLVGSAGAWSMNADAQPVPVVAAEPTPEAAPIAGARPARAPSPAVAGANPEAATARGPNGASAKAVAPGRRSSAESEAASSHEPALASSATDTDSVQAFLESNPEIDCAVENLWSAPSRVWVACGAAGYLVLQRTADGFRLLESRRVEGEVHGFFAQGGRVWAQVVEERALVVGRVGPSEIGAVSEPQSVEAEASRPLPTAGEIYGASEPPRPDAPEAATEVVVGEVIKLDGLNAEINIGTLSGVSNGSRIALLDVERAAARGSAVVGKVVDVDENWARVRIGFNERVGLGASARLTDEPITGSRVAPERVVGLWEVRGMLRPLLSLGDFGGGVLGEFEAGYRTRYFHVGARLTPVGVASADRSETVSTWGGYVYGAYDSTVFSAGLGVGAQAVNDTSGLSERGAGLSLVQLLRLGAVDGLHLASRTHAVVFRSQTEFSGLEIQGQISVTSDAWLILRGGGGSAGYGYGEIAVRNLLDGNGGRGSVFLEVSVGGAGIYQEICSNDVEVFGFGCSSSAVGGPLVGVGAEWRL